MSIGKHGLHESGKHASKLGCKQTESIKLIWHTLITTLTAHYERIEGTDDASELMRLNFKKRWCSTTMAAKIGVDST